MIKPVRVTVTDLQTGKTEPLRKSPVNDLPHEQAFQVERRAAAIIRQEERRRCIAAIWDNPSLAEDEKRIATDIIQKLKD